MGTAALLPGQGVERRSLDGARFVPRLKGGFVQMCSEGGWRCSHGQGPSEDSLLLERTLLAALKHGVVRRASKEESQFTFR